MAKTATRPPKKDAPTAAVPPVEEHHGIINARMLTFFGVLAAIFLSALDQTIVGTALPKVVADLNGFDRYTWVTTVYLLTATAVVPVVGKLSEQLGRKRVFLSGIVIFLLGSFVCGASQSMTQLIVFRAFQGLGAGGHVRRGAATPGRECARSGKDLA